MVTNAGLVKVLDFGLAAIGQQPLVSGQDLPTLTMSITGAGVIMGTAAYMSPEQASGKPVDKGADMWSFGVVLYEMLTGKRLFGGETFSHTLADVLRAPIDFSRVNAPAPIRDLLKRCLDRDVKTRLRDMGEARIAIRRYLAHPNEVTARVPVPPPSRLVAAWMVAAVAVVAAGLLAWRLASTAAATDRPPMRFSIELGPDAVRARRISVSRRFFLPTAPVWYTQGERPTARYSCTPDVWIRIQAACLRPWSPLSIPNPSFRLMSSGSDSARAPRS